MRLDAVGACLGVVLVAAVTVAPGAGNRPRASQEAAGEPSPAAARIAAHPLRLGMTEAEVVRSDWGRPDRVERSAAAADGLEYWFYRQGPGGAGNRRGVILIEDGVVTYFHDEVAH
jgi:hypothetical protein